LKKNCYISYCKEGWLIGGDNEQARQIFDTLESLAEKGTLFNKHLIEFCDFMESIDMF
jgi:hypothetical protein